MTNPSLDRLLALDHGVFTTREAMAQGLTPFDLLRLVKAGAIDHLARGVYAGRQGATPLPAEAHLRLAAGVLRTYPDSVLTHHSAALALGLPVWGADLSTVLIARRVRRERLAQHWVIRSRPAWLGPVQTAYGRCSGPAATIIQHSLESGAVAGIVAADFAIHEDRVTRDALEETAGFVSGWPRSHHVQTLLAHLDGRSESPGESRLRVDLAMGGVDVVPQVTIRDERGRFVARVDLMVRGTRIVIEFDGLVKYRDGGAEALIAEKRREDELRRLGYVVLRFTWADLANPGAVLRRVRAAVAASPRNVDVHPTSKVG